MTLQLHAVLKATFRCGVLVTLFIAPTQWALELKPKFYLSLADITVLLTGMAFGLDMLIQRDWKRLRFPPFIQILFVGSAGLSMLVAEDRMATLKDLVQFTEYFILGSILFSAFLRDYEDALKHAIFVWMGATTVIIGWALVQYFNPAVDVLKVSATFGNRNVFGGFLALALPLLFGLAMDSKKMSKVFFYLLILAGLIVTLSGAAYFVIVGVMLCMALKQTRQLFLPFVAILLLFQILLLPKLPRENDLVHFQSLALYDGTGMPTRRYPDWQAAYNMTLTYPWLGVGLGNYQKRIGQFYEQVPRQTGPAEPDIQNLYWVLAASAGFPTLVFFIAMLVTAIRKTRRSRAHGSDWRAPLATGVAGAITAFAFTAIWHPLLVRGIGLPLVFILALANHLQSEERMYGEED